MPLFAYFSQSVPTGYSPPATLLLPSKARVTGAILSRRPCPGPWVLPAQASSSHPGPSHTIALLSATGVVFFPGLLSCSGGQPISVVSWQGAEEVHLFEIWHVWKRPVLSHASLRAHCGPLSRKWLRQSCGVKCPPGVIAGLRPFWLLTLCVGHSPLWKLQDLWIPHSDASQHVH